MDTGNEELKYRYKYPHPGVTTDCVLFGYDGVALKVLLVQRGFEPYKGCWAFPGGFMDISESAEDGAARELEEETGVRNVRLTQFKTFTAPGRDPRERVVTVAFYALVRLQEVAGSDDAADARWFGLDEIPPLAFDHDDMLRTAVEAVRRHVCFKPIGYGILPETFTIGELRLLYEAVLGVKLDGERFYCRMKELGALECVSTGGNHCHGEKRFRFDAGRYKVLEEQGFSLDFHGWKQQT